MVTYTFYGRTFGGSSILQQDWVYYEGRAESKLKQYERDYTVTVPEGEDPVEARARAICALADVMASFDAIGSGAAGPVASIKTGEVSVSYALGSGAIDLSEKGQARALYEAARQYLDIYRGVR